MKTTFAYIRKKTYKRILFYKKTPEFRQFIFGIFSYKCSILLPEPDNSMGR